MKLEVFSDADTVAREAAAIIGAEARLATSLRSRFVMAVSGGRTLWLMLCALAGEVLPWEAVNIVQVDGRLAPAGGPDRNLTHLRGSLQAHAPLRPEQTHPMPVEASASELELAAARYAEARQQAAGMPPVRLSVG